MKKDNWSLKGRKTNILESTGYYTYDGNDIETLRQQLIEDMKSILEIERLKYESRGDTVDRCIGFVNKRFGIK